MKRLLVTMVVLSFVFAGCATAAPRKEQAEQSKAPAKADEYPASRYMTATGIGKSEIEARNSAVAELSKIFESKVSSDTLDRIRAVIPSKGKEQITQTLESNVKVVSVVQLKGVQVPKTWFDEQKRNYYALAVLDRAQARDTWMRDIENLDHKIEGEQKTLSSQSSKFLRLRSLKRIFAMWVEREVIVSRIRVLGSNEGAVAPYDIKALFAMLPEIKQSMLVAMAVGGDQAKLVREALATGLSNAGYIIGADRAKADVVISGTIHVEPVKLNNPGWEFARAAISLTITDVATGNTVGEVADSVRASHVNYPEAVNKAVRQLSASASEKLVLYFEE